MTQLYFIRMPTIKLNSQTLASSVPETTISFEPTPSENQPISVFQLLLPHKQKIAGSKKKLEYMVVYLSLIYEKNLEEKKFSRQFLLLL